MSPFYEIWGEEGGSEGKKLCFGRMNEDGDCHFLPPGAPPSFQPFGLGLCIWSRIGLTGVYSSFEIILL